MIKTEVHYLLNFKHIDKIVESMSKFSQEFTGGGPFPKTYKEWIKSGNFSTAMFSKELKMWFFDAYIENDIEPFPITTNYYLK